VGKPPAICAPVCGATLSPGRTMNCHCSPVLITVLALAPTTAAEEGKAHSSPTAHLIFGLLY
jgi:hypothetical protein